MEIELNRPHRGARATIANSPYFNADSPYFNEELAPVPIEKRTW